MRPPSTSSSRADALPEFDGPFSLGFEGERWDKKLSMLLIPWGDTGSDIAVYISYNQYAIIFRNSLKRFEIDQTLELIAYIHGLISNPTR
jgi:hypothetical protein